MAVHLNNVAHLVSELFNHGIRHVVISPGSRSAPLTILFSQIETVQKYVIVDERVAAFFALGMAQQLRMPVALICTSGTATLNYAPALAEAYYAQVPLLAITADRPLQWLNNAEGQQIDQTNVFKNFVAASFTYNTSLANENLNSIVPEAFGHLSATSRPVHINVPIDEPLYSNVPIPLQLSPVFNKLNNCDDNQLTSLQYLLKVFGSNQKIMIVIGSRLPDKTLDSALEKLQQFNNLVIISESLSNITATGVVKMPDLLLPSIKNTLVDEYKPEVLITISTNLISKHLKDFLRKNKPAEHVHIDAFGFFPDTFGSLSHTIRANPVDIIPMLTLHANTSVKSNYRQLWNELSRNISDNVQSAKINLPWSEIKAFDILHNFLKNGSLLHLGNSLPVRYAQYFEARHDIMYFSNRGTSGIDGSLSTAIGASVANNSESTIILGDLSFMYDSNALWQEQLPENLKIVIFNNGGGGIFRVINGPNSFDKVERYFQARHTRNFLHIANHYNLPYFNVATEDELINILPVFYSVKGTAILEICTDWQENSNVLKEYIQTIIN